MVPMVVLPVVWGVWNVLWVRRQPAMGVARGARRSGSAWRAPSTSCSPAAGVWFSYALLIVPFLPLVYWLLWGFVVGPLNEALGVEGGAQPR